LAFGVIVRVAKEASEMEAQTIYAVESEQKRNQAAYESLKGELEKKYWGRFVVIAEGRFVADALTFEEVVRKGDQIVPGATHRIVFKVGSEDEFGASWSNMKRGSEIDGLPSCATIRRMDSPIETCCIPMVPRINSPFTFWIRT